MTRLRPVGLLLCTCLLVRAILLFGRPVAAAATSAAAATFLACAFHGTIAGLALFHGGERLIRARWPRLRLLLPILRFAFTLSLTAIASLIAPGVRVLARAPLRLVAFVPFGAAFGAAVSMVAAR